MLLEICTIILILVAILNAICFYYTHRAIFVVLLSLYLMVIFSCVIVYLKRNTKYEIIVECKNKETQKIISTYPTYIEEGFVRIQEQPGKIWYVGNECNVSSTKSYIKK